jgi:hypothetical protein
LHVCALTRTHTLLSAPCGATRSVPLGNVHPSKSVRHRRNCFRVSPQEPRRPRFSFFHLHNFKELTSLPSRARTSLEALLPNSSRERDPVVRLPGRSSALSDCAEQWERLALASSTLAGCIRDVFVCQHPISVFRLNPKPETLKPKIAF